MNSANVSSPRNASIRSRRADSGSPGRRLRCAVVARDRPPELEPRADERDPVGEGERESEREALDRPARDEAPVHRDRGEHSRHGNRREADLVEEPSGRGLRGLRRRALRSSASSRRDARSGCGRRCASPTSSTRTSESRRLQAAVRPAMPAPTTTRSRDMVSDATPREDRPPGRLVAIRASRLHTPQPCSRSIARWRS